MTNPGEGAVLKTLLMSDLVGSTGLVEKLGDATAAQLFARHDAKARDLLIEHRGREIDKADGFFLIFDRPLDAVRYALAYHQALREMSVETGLCISARVGIHLGEVFLRANPPAHVERGAKPLEVEGLAKPVTARIMSLATGHQTLLTRPAYELAHRSAGEETSVAGDVCWQAHGAYRLQGVKRPMRVFEVGIEGAAPLQTPCDVTKIRAVTVPSTLGPQAAPATLLPAAARARTLRAMPAIHADGYPTPDHPRSLAELKEAVRQAAHEMAAIETAAARRRWWATLAAVAAILLTVVAYQQWRVYQADRRAEALMLGSSAATTPAAPQPTFLPIGMTTSPGLGPLPPGWDPSLGEAYGLCPHGPPRPDAAPRQLY